MPNIIDSYSESNRNTDYNVQPSGGNAYKVSQSFTGNGATLGSAVFYLKKLGSPTGNATAEIYAHSGSFGTSSVPTGAALATSDSLDISTLTTTQTLTTLNFTGGNQIVLTNGTKYCVVFTSNNGDLSNNVVLGVDTISPTHGGNDATYVASWTAHSTRDACFYVYDNAGASEPDLDVTVTAGNQNIGGVRIV